MEKVMLKVLLFFVSYGVFAIGGSTTGGGGVTPDALLYKNIIDLNQINNVQLNNGVITSKEDLIKSIKGTLKNDNLGTQRLHDFGIDNFQMNSGEIIQVEPEGLYITE